MTYFEWPDDVDMNQTETAIYLTKNLIKGIVEINVFINKFIWNAYVTMLLERRTIPPLHVSSTGNVTRLTFHIYLRTELFSSQYSRFQINSQVAAARLYVSGHNVVELGDERVTSIFRVHQV